MRRWHGATLVAAAACFAAPASAAPQWTVGLYTGASGESASGRWWERTAWFSGARADVLLLRESNFDVGLGPYVDVSTASFEDVRAGGGLSWLLPVSEDVPFIVSAGGFGRLADGELIPGWTGQLFVGSRGFNFHSSYGMGSGLLLGLQQELEPRRHRTVFVAAQVDLEVLLLPGVLVYELIRGPRARK